MAFGAPDSQAVGVVGGRNRKGQFVLTTFGTADNYQPDTQPARQGAYLIEGAASHTEIAPWLEREVKPDAPNWRSLDDVAISALSSGSVPAMLLAVASS